MEEGKNNIINSELDEKLLKRLDDLLEQYGKLYKEYTCLIRDKEIIKIKYMKKNKKNIVLNIIFLMVLSSLFLFLVKLNLIELFELWPNICMIIYNSLFVCLLGYEGYLLFTRLCDDKKIYEGLNEDEEFVLLMKKIKIKEKELCDLNVKFMNLDNIVLNDEVINSYVFNENKDEKDYNLVENKNNLVRRRIKE